jgi:glutathione S-transferase
MLKLYGGKRSRANIVRWYLEELNLPYEFVLLDMQSGAHLQADFLQINPMGKVPAIVDGDFVLWESGAILLYLAEKTGNLPNSLAERAILNQWVLFANSTLSNGLFLEANRERETPRLLAGLERVLQGRAYLMGTEFSVADVAVGAVLGFAVQMVKTDLAPYAHVSSYVQKLRERPAFQQAMV